MKIVLLSRFQQSIVSQNEPPDLTALTAIHQNHFREADPERFRFIWCSIAQLCRVDPLHLDREEQLVNLCPMASRWSNVNERMDDIEEFALSESNGRPIPDNLRTVGAMVDWLLGTGAFQR